MIKDRGRIIFVAINVILILFELASACDKTLRCDSDADCCNLIDGTTASAVCINGTCQKMHAYSCASDAACVVGTVGIPMPSWWTCSTESPVVGVCTSHKCVYSSKRPPNLVGAPGQCPKCYEFIPFSGCPQWGHCAPLSECCDDSTEDCDACYTCDPDTQRCTPIANCCEKNSDCEPTVGTSKTTVCDVPICLKEYEESPIGQCMAGTRCTAGHPDHCYDDDPATSDSCPHDCKCCHLRHDENDECLNDDDCIGWDPDFGQECQEVAGNMKCNNPEPHCLFDADCADESLHCCGGGICDEDCLFVDHCPPEYVKECGDVECCMECVCDQCCTPTTPCHSHGIVPTCSILRDFTHPYDGMEGVIVADYNIATPFLDSDGYPVFDTTSHPLSFSGGNATFWSWYHDVAGINVAINATDVFVLMAEMDVNPHLWVFDPHPRADVNLFYPIDGLGFGNDGTDSQGNSRNFHFTMAACFQFRHIAGGGHIEYVVDDGLFIFLDDAKVLEVSGVQPARAGNINVGTGLAVGSMHEVCVFFQERHTIDSVLHFSIYEDVLPSCGDRGLPCDGLRCWPKFTCENDTDCHMIPDAMCCDGVCKVVECCHDHDCATPANSCFVYACFNGMCGPSDVPKLDCDDGIACTVDGCFAGQCTHVANDSICAGGDYGTCGVATCDLVDGCVTHPDLGRCPNMTCLIAHCSTVVPGTHAKYNCGYESDPRCHSSSSEHHRELCVKVRDFTLPYDGMQGTIATDYGLVLPTLGTDGYPQYNPAAHPSTMSNGNSTFWSWYHNSSHSQLVDAPGAFVLVYQAPHWVLVPTLPATTGAYFPIDSLGYGNDGTDSGGVPHNFFFTVATCFLFEHVASGGAMHYAVDDGLYVYVDGTLVLDIGGVQPTRSGIINIGTSLVVGSVHEMCLFFQERHTVGSVFEFWLQENVLEPCQCVDVHCIGESSSEQPPEFCIEVRDFTLPYDGMQQTIATDYGLALPTLGADGYPQYNSAAHSATMSNGNYTFWSWYHNSSHSKLVHAPGAFVLVYQAPRWVLVPDMPATNAKYFPIDGLGYGNDGVDANGVAHNFFFTVATCFRFEHIVSGGAMHYAVDDGLYVYIDGSRVLDVGGVQPTRSGTINIGTSLVVGSVHEMCLFFQERHTVGSVFEFWLQEDVQMPCNCIGIHCSESSSSEIVPCAPGECYDFDFCTIDHCDPCTHECSYTPGACELVGKSCCGRVCVDPNGPTDASCNGTDPCYVYLCDPDEGCVSYKKPECRCHNDSDCEESGSQDDDLCKVFGCDLGTGECRLKDEINCTEVIPMRECLPCPFDDEDDGSEGEIEHECEDGWLGECAQSYIDVCLGGYVQVLLDAQCDPLTGKCPYLKECDDFNHCTTDVCEEIWEVDDSDPSSTAIFVGHECLHIEKNCSDNNATTVDTCDPETGECHHRTCVECPEYCNDNNSCTVDYYDHEHQCCKHVPINCTDSNLCTTDFCHEGVCYNVDYHHCVDGDPCTVDRCNPLTGQCDFSEIMTCPSDGDGDACTYMECDSQCGACVPRVVDCGPHSHGPCATDECVDGICIHHNDPLCFSDPEILNITRQSKCFYPVCNPSTGCYVEEVQCDDHNPCTTEACNPYTGLCIYCPVHCPCADDCRFYDDDEHHHHHGNRSVSNPECDRYRSARQTVMTLRDHQNEDDDCVVCGCSADRGGCYIDPVTCEDSNPCTEDVCLHHMNPRDGTTDIGCTHRPRDCGCTPEGRLKTDKCKLCWCSSVAGGCQTTPLDCNDHDPETLDFCADGECIHRRRECNDTDTDLCTDFIFNNVTNACEHVPHVCPPIRIPGTQLLDLCVLPGVCVPETGACWYAPKICGNPENKCTSSQCDPYTGDCSPPTVKDCDDDNACTDDSCNARTGLCKHTTVTCPPSSYGRCGYTYCSTDAGGCVDVPYSCNDGNVCTSDSCDPHTGECVHPLTPAAQTCKSHSTKCVHYRCDPYDGACRQHPKVCHSDDPCYVSLCDPNCGECYLHARCLLGPIDMCFSGTCDHDDGECHVVQTTNCTTNDMCRTGQCDTDVGCVYTDKDCDDHNPCTRDWCRPQDGACHHEPTVCDDGDPSTIDTCNATDGTCTHTRRFPCDDPRACMDGYVNSTTGQCVYVDVICPPVVGDDGNDDLCYVGTCVEPTGCQYEYHDCMEGITDLCVWTECMPETGECSEIAPRVCPNDDNNLCTQEICDSTSGACVPHRITCDDGRPCTVDNCDRRTGTCSNVLKSCSDNDECTQDMCVESTGECQHSPRHVCTSPTHDACETCACNRYTGNCDCVRESCSDGNLCTEDLCDCHTGECSNPPIVCPERKCEIGVCVPASGNCQYSALDCDDHNHNTHDYCDPDTGQCRHITHSHSEDVYSSEGCLYEDDDDETHHHECDHDEDGHHGHNGNNHDGCEDDDDDGQHNRGDHDNNGHGHNGHDNDGHDGHHNDGHHEHDDCKDRPKNKCVTYVFVEAADKWLIASSKNCTDANACTIDWCNKDTGQCMHDMNHCDDRDACTVDSCNPITGMCYHEPVDCDDHDACTTDRCNSHTGYCSHELIINTLHDRSIKDKNNKRTRTVDVWQIRDGCINIVCDPTNGAITNVPIDCVDDNPCTTDFCDDYLGDCVHDTISCDDSAPCTYEECVPLGQTEDSGYSCFRSTKQCDDGISTTIDWCDETTGECRHAHVVCENLDPCMVNATDAHGNCVATPRVCDDHNPCTYDRCDPVARSCVYTDHGRCDDGNLCTIDSCNPATGSCVHVPKNCDDDDLCTTDTCVSSTGKCHHEPLECVDANPCTINTCNPHTGYCEFITKACNDNNMCTLDFCDVTDGMCSHIFYACDEYRGHKPCRCHVCEPRTGLCEETLNLTCWNEHDHHDDSEEDDNEERNVPGKYDDDHNNRRHLHHRGEDRHTHRRNHGEEDNNDDGGLWYTSLPAIALYVTFGLLAIVAVFVLSSKHKTAMRR